MTNRKAGGASYEFAPPAGAQRLGEYRHAEEVRARMPAAGNWKTIGALSNGVVRRVRYLKARH